MLATSLDHVDHFLFQLADFSCFREQDAALVLASAGVIGISIGISLVIGITVSVAAGITVAISVIAGAAVAVVAGVAVAISIIARIAVRCLVPAVMVPVSTVSVVPVMAVIILLIGIEKFDLRAVQFCRIFLFRHIQAA